jgi:hypothetical protein
MACILTQTAQPTGVQCESTQNKKLVYFLLAVIRSTIKNDKLVVRLDEAYAEKFGSFDNFQMGMYSLESLWKRLEGKCEASGTNQLEMIVQINHDAREIEHASLVCDDFATDFSKSSFFGKLVVRGRNTISNGVYCSIVL